MDIRDTIKRTIDKRDADHTMGAAALGGWIAGELEMIGVVVDGDDVAQRIRQIDPSRSLTSGELADALAEEIEADLDEDGE